jgi:phage terminase Nu1 subunit (DNA packaging protein)
MGELSQGSQEASKPSEGRLDSWKEIAAYLKRDVTTVQRWERREGMPVHRHLHDKARFSPTVQRWMRGTRAANRSRRS